MIEIEKVDRHPRRKPGSLKISENSWYLACEPFEILKSRAGRILKKHYRGRCKQSAFPFQLNPQNSMRGRRCEIGRKAARWVQRDTHDAHSHTKKKRGKKCAGASCVLTRNVHMRGKKEQSVSPWLIFIRNNQANPFHNNQHQSTHPFLTRNQTGTRDQGPYCSNRSFNPRNKQEVFHLESSGSAACPLRGLPSFTPSRTSQPHNTHLTHTIPSTEAATPKPTTRGLVLQIS